jgi:integrase/recombinase XerC
MNIDGFLDYLRHEKRYSAKTVVSYGNDLHQFFTFVERTAPIREIEQITSKQIRAYLVYMMRDRKLAPATVRRKLSSVNTFFNYQVRRNGLRQNPARDVASLKLPQRIPQYLNPVSMDRMTADLSSGDKDDLRGMRTFLIIEMLYNTGMRRQELIDLKWSDINSERKNIRVMGKGSKERLVPVSSGMLADLDKFRQLTQAEFGNLPKEIFVTNSGKKLYPKFVYNLVRKYLTAYSSLKKRSPHVLRHTFATHLLNNGADLNDIKELLGHSSLASTQVYTHNSIEELKHIYKQAHPKS